MKPEVEQAIRDAAREVALAAQAVNPDCILDEKFLAGVIRARLAPIVEGLQKDLDRSVAVGNKWYREAKAAKTPKVSSE